MWWGNLQTFKHNLYNVSKHRQVSFRMEKKGNVIPIHKKDDKRNVKNYRPVSLLPVCGKITERLIYNVMYDFLADNNLLSANQSGFRSVYSCISQLLSINHEILNAFDKGLGRSSWDISWYFKGIWQGMACWPYF